MVTHTHSLPVITQDQARQAHSARLTEGESTPEAVVAWALRRFGAGPFRLAATTGFGMEGCALVDMLDKAGATIDVLYLDTHFLFPETLALRDRLAARYPSIRLLNVGTGYTEAEQARDHGPRLWATNPDLCCKIRKVDPMKKALAGYDVWFAAIRRDQSPARANTRFVDWHPGHELVRVSPLAYWSRAAVWDYIRSNNVPYNELHERGYPTIGCTHCTAPVPGSTPDSYSREGRWAGTGKTECGLHLGENI